MATSQEATPRDLLSLVLRSRKALDHTKTLCARADSLSKDSTELALDLVAVDAKVRWATDLILEQLKVEDTCFIVVTPPMY
jgi:autophagy-related protein 17